MKKNIIIVLLLAVIAALLIFIRADKRIVIRKEYADVKNTEEGYTEVLTEAFTKGHTEAPATEDTEAAAYAEKDNAVGSLPAEAEKTVVIDPGHQSRGNSEKEPIAPGASEQKAKVSSGTSGIVSGTPEYAVNLQVSLLLRDELERRGYSVVMTRETNDVDISNSQRANVANSINADAFVRIHCNGSENQVAKGALTMCQTASNPYCGNFYTQSRALSQCILDSLCSATGTENRGVTQTDTMSGINWCQVPVTIVEMGFMTNPEEDRLLNDSQYQNKLSVGIANGIDNFFRTLY